MERAFLLSNNRTASRCSCSIRFFNPAQYITDLKTGNVNIGEVLRSVLFHLFNIYQDRSKRVLPSCLTLKKAYRGLSRMS